MTTNHSTLLIDDSTPATETDVLSRLFELSITQQTIRHAPVFTVVEAKALRGELEGAHIKNLFLRNKKGRMWLVTCHEDRQINMNRLAEHLDAKRLSFASAERLMRYLGVTPGAVTPLAAINDKTGLVTIVLDQAILTDSLINVHPLHNAATTALAPADLLRFLEDVDHHPLIVDMSMMSEAT